MSFAKNPWKHGHPYDGDGISQEECAKRLGITRARVSQIERQAIRKMRMILIDRGIVFGELINE